MVALAKARRMPSGIGTVPVERSIRCAKASKLRFTGPSRRERRRVHYYASSCRTFSYSSEESRSPLAGPSPEVRSLTIQPSP